MIKIVLLVGARPNFMKIAPIIRAIHKHNQLNKLNELNQPIHPLLIHSGQHYDYQMSQVFFQDLELPQPDVHLEVGSGTHAEQTGKAMIELEKVLLRERPGLVVVVGDVNSTLAGALAAVKLHIPVAHVEAGLRSGDRSMPEEINRLLTDAISDYLFTPSPDADDNLEKEGIPSEKIFLVGNVMIDSLLHNKPLADRSDILQRLGLLTGVPCELNEPNKLNQPKELNRLNELNQHPTPLPYALLTLHRPSNVDDRESLAGIMTAITRISERIPVVFPAHPRTHKKLQEFGLLPDAALAQLAEPNKRKELKKLNELVLTPPLGYLDFLKLTANATLVLTDSGGIQEETTVLGVPCLTLRNSTERPITITKGTNTLVGNDPQRIMEEAARVLDSRGKKGSIPALWDGRTADRIVSIIVQRTTAPASASPDDAGKAGQQ